MSWEVYGIFWILSDMSEECIGSVLTHWISAEDSEVLCKYMDLIVELWRKENQLPDNLGKYRLESVVWLIGPMKLGTWL